MTKIKQHCVTCGKPLTAIRKYGKCVRCVKLGKSLSAEHRQNVSKALSGSRSSAWKGDNVGYGALHDWVRKQLGKAIYCSNDKSHKSWRYEWANISGEYKRDVSDYRSLCVACHRKPDLEHFSRTMARKRFEKVWLRNRVKVSQYTLDGKLVASFDSIAEAASSIGVSRGVIDGILSGRTRNSRGYIWKTSKEENL